MLSDVRGVRAERPVLVDSEPIRYAMPLDTSREPLPLVGERCVGDRPFANHVADVFWRLRDGPLELI